MVKEIVKMDGNEQSKSKVLKFDVSEDVAIRAQAKNAYSLSRVFKEIGIKIKRVTLAASDPSIVKLFKLGPNSPLFCIELENPKTPEEKFDKISEIKDQLLIMDNIQVIDEKQYTYEPGNIVYRILIKFTKDPNNQNQTKSNVKDSRSN